MFLKFQAWFFKLQTLDKVVKTLEQDHLQQAQQVRDRLVQVQQVQDHLVQAQLEQDQQDLSLLSALRLHLNKQHPRFN